MSNVEFTPVFKTPDGRVFDTKAEAQTHIRRPKILAAMLAVVDNDNDIANFLIDQREGVETAFDAGTIKRVSKSDSSKLQKALEHAASLNDSKLGFITENAEAILASFRWPSVKRMDDAEKETAAVTSLGVLCEGNTELATYIYSKREGITEAYSAGVEKRQVNPAAKAALEAYHAKRRAEKEAAEAAKATEEAPAA
jgi:hypothetical protein